MLNKKISSDLFLLVLLVVRLRLDSDIGLNDPPILIPQSREVFLGSSSASTQISFHSPYPNVQYPHPKSLELNEQDEAAILFNRLNYFNSVRERNLLAYYASSPGTRNANASASDGEENPSAAAQSPDEGETTPSLINDLSPEDMDLIEILWKQDIDLGVSRDAYDSRPSVEIEKLKDVEIAKENLKEFYIPGEKKNVEENEIEQNPLAGLNYTVDSETGEFVVEELCGASEDETQFPAVNCDSYLPCSVDDAQLSNLSDVFPLDFFTDSDFLLSNIDDFEKELSAIADNDPHSEAMFSQAEDVFPNVDDCWPDSTTMLPLLSLGNSHPTSYNNPLPSRPTDGFTGILHTSTLDISTADETFHTIPSSLGHSSVGCALAESLATLHNDSDPLPPSSLLNTAYHSDLPQLLYSNQSVSAPHNQLLINDLFTEEDFALTMPSQANHRTLNEDHIDTSSDSASLASGRVPSVSDCQADWIDSCSESSSHHGENPTHSFLPGSVQGNSLSQNSHLYQSSMLPKRQRQLDDHNADLRGGVNKSDFPIKSEYSRAYENNSCKFDYNVGRCPGAACSSILQHNHSYHLPFSSSESNSKPLVRDKTKSSSSEEDACNKDEKRARELNIPITIDDIINLAIEEYNERLSKYELTDQQLNLIRDIRRRGKNKVAAQNCRKRKMDQISSLQQDLDSLENEKMQLKSKQNVLVQEKHCIEDKYSQLYQIVSQHTNCNSSNSVSGHNNNNQQMTLPSTPDVYMSDDDSDLSRGARTKRKLKK